MADIKNLSPVEIWRNFDKLTQVPRPSGHLEKIQAYLLNWAKEAGVEAFQDAAGNIVMRKPATPGMENRKGVILQAHMDMVPQKAPESNHDFENDPIETIIDGDWVRANHTTLGSDDGLGVATIMAVMEAKDLQHGPVEGLITADEETGMFGANGLPEGELNGDILLNLDTEVWGEFVIGSAGANKCMVRFVREAISELDARLASWQGGNMRNAIPFQAQVVLTLPKENIEALNDMVADWKDELIDEFQGIEVAENIEFFTENVETPAKEVPQEIQDNLVDAIFACHDGVLRMAPSMPGIVETSSNLAIIEIGEGKAAIKILARSSHEYYKMYLATMMESCFNMAGMKVEFSGAYGGWNPNPKSDILEHVLKVYKEQNGKDGVVQAVHAGLECSIILGKYSHLDVVSFGPTLLSPHTANERCQISCVAPFWNLMKQLLAEIPAK